MLLLKDRDGTALVEIERAPGKPDSLLIDGVRISLDTLRAFVVKPDPTIWLRLERQGNELLAIVMGLEKDADRPD